jgi:hypothetical protein
MESMPELRHPTDQQLASFLDPGLEPEALDRLVAHLDSCPVCEAWLEEIEPAFSNYRRCLEAVHANVPRPDLKLRTRGDWTKDLWTRMECLEAKRSPGRTGMWRFAWLSGAVAAMAGVLFFLLPTGSQAELRADTLLAQAARSAAKSRPPQRLRVRTRNASFVRPAVRTAAFRAEPEEAALEAAVGERFLAANYDWREPLNPQSYADWRHNLKHKTSKVTPVRDQQTGEQEQSVETVTKEGSIQDASLTFDSVLQPVSGRFQFSDQEWVEITIAPDDPAAQPKVLAAVLPAPPAAKLAEPALAPENPVQTLTGRELNVRLAIDALNMGAGEPVEVNVEPGGAIDVTTYGLRPDREKLLRSGLDQIPGVVLRAEANKQSAPPQIVEKADRVLRDSQDVSFEAHFLSEMSNRFPSSAEAALSAADRAKLLELRRKHSIQLERGLAELRGELEAERSGFHPAPSSEAGALAQTASNMDRLITLHFASKQTEAARLQAWRELESEFGKLESAAHSYRERLESGGGN